MITSWSWYLISWKFTLPLQWFTLFTWKNENQKKIEKFVAYLHDEKHYVMHIRNLIEALNHGLVFTARMHRVHCCTKHEVFH